VSEVLPAGPRVALGLVTFPNRGGAVRLKRRERMKRAPKIPPVRKLILKSSLSPGDIVMLTAAVRDLHHCYPRRFLTDARTSCPELWERNPHLTPLAEDDPGVEVLECHYPLIHRCNTTPYHCLHGYIEFLNDRLGLSIRPTAFQGEILLSEREKSWFSQVRELTGEDTPFWILVAGGKLDYTIKWWEARRFQEVVDHFAGRIQFVQVGDTGHYHPRLSGVIDLRGQTDLRQLVRLVHHSQGVLCPVTSLMHLAAAVEPKPGLPRHRPCVVVGGGREPNQWEAYPHHQFLHTNGALACCAEGGCWRSRTAPLGDGGENDQPDAICVNVVGGLPKCMDLITASQVIQKIETYFAGGIINYLSPRQARRALAGIRATRDNPFDERLNRVTARAAAEAFIARIPPVPEDLRGRGIVLCGGGLRYFPGVWITLNMLRSLGCALPVEIWHRGKAECELRMRALTAPLGAQWVDAEEVRIRHPARQLGGGELKAYALLHCSFKQALLLDADNVPVVNPEHLFETPEFKRAGAVLWPGPLPAVPAQEAWGVFGVAPREGPQMDSGQALLDKERCWAVVNLCWWYNDHSDFYYEFANGGEVAFPMAFYKLERPFALPPAAQEIKVGLCQHDFEGRRIFQHRAFDPWNLFRRNQEDPEFLFEAECFAWLDVIRRQWDRKESYYRLIPSSRPAPRRAPLRETRPTARADFVLVTLYDAAFREVAKVTATRMRQYAQRHGYRFVEHRALLDPARHPSWNKILAVSRLLDHSRAKWVMWVDADAVIMNLEQRLEDLLVEGRDLIFGSDFNGLNCAVFLVRNCAWTRRFFATVYNLGDINYAPDQFGPKWEQNTIKHLLQNFTGFDGHVAIHPERRMTPLPGSYRAGDFILHLGGMSTAQRVKTLAELDLPPGR